MNRIIVILDRSGSMSHIKKETIDGFNSFIESQKENALTNGHFPKFTLILFNQTVNSSNFNSILDLPLMDSNVYNPDGMTSLHDAIGTGFEMWNGEPNNLCLIITDGKDNMSKKYSQTQIKAEILRLKQFQNWEFVYYGADQEIVKEAERLGIIHTRDYRQNSGGAALLFEQVSNDVDLICSQMSRSINLV